MKKHYNYQKLTGTCTKSNFIKGMARALDVGSTTNKRCFSKSANNSDENALMSDWLVVGEDIRRAMNGFRR